MRDAHLLRFDEESLPDHFYLAAEDECYYFLEYTARKPFNYSHTNNFINNLKKSPLRRGTYQYNYKINAMSEAAQALLRELPEEWLTNSTFVPIPPSKAQHDPEYDDRMSQILVRMGKIDARELVYQVESMNATHVLEDRHSIDALVRNYAINEDEADPEPSHIVVIDDMVTAGAHYRAMERVLVDRFPSVPISGVFLARRVFATDGA